MGAACANVLVPEGRDWRWEPVPRDCGRVKNCVQGEQEGDHGPRRVALGSHPFFL